MEWIIFGLIALGIFSFIKDKVFSNKVTYTDSEGKQKTEQLTRRQSKRTALIEKPENFELTPENKKILDNFENTNSNIFLTGKAGTGKSTLLRYFRATTNKNHVVVAPTGVAAINVQGQTIHSFFGFGIDITPSRVRFVRPDKLLVLRKLETLIIDEISMVRADLLDCIDRSLKLNRRSQAPFGGVQVIIIGDPYQLPPVVKSSEMKYFNDVYGGPHFFNAKSYKEAAFEKLSLHKIYRQEGDNEFINILNSVRVGDLNQVDIDNLNKRSEVSPHPESVKLVTTRALATFINNTEMRKLPGEEKIFKATIVGDFKENVVPTDMELVLKEGSRVMLLNNDKNGRWVNGDIGYVISMGENSVRVIFDDKTYDDVDLNEWDNIKFIYDEESGKIEPEVVGKFIQLPLKLAWAVTIHKSQGKTYDYVHIDFGTGTFAPGQAYVALSRCTSLQGLSLEAPMMKSDILIDNQVKIFMDFVEPKDSVDLINFSQAEIKEVDLKDKNISQSDINKMYFFMKNSEKYATGSIKAKSKVEEAISTFNSIKSTLGEDSIKEFELALNRYKAKLRN